MGCTESTEILWMEETLHDLGWLKASKYWAKTATTTYQLGQDFFHTLYLTMVK